VETGWEEGRRYAVDGDLKSFFDTVNQDRLMGCGGRRSRIARS
jgi:hypothetical protein